MSWFKEKLCGQCAIYRDRIVELEHDFQDYMVKLSNALEFSKTHKAWYDNVKDDYYGYRETNRKLKIEIEYAQLQVKSVLEVNKLLIDQLSLYEKYKTKEKE